MLAAYTLRLTCSFGFDLILKSLIQPALLFGLIAPLGIPNPLAREGVVAAALPSAGGCTHARRPIQDPRGRGWCNAAFGCRAGSVPLASVAVRGAPTPSSAC